jgi:ABC-type transport system involved in cytochrome bd biosynthesis fused ATPase/permease subunit
LIFFDYLESAYHAYLPYALVVGYLIIGVSIGGLMFDTFFFRGAHTLILAYILVLGWLSYTLGRKSNSEGREDEAQYDPTIFE